MMETAFEHILISGYKEDMISYLENHPEDFEQAINLAIDNKPIYSKRAAWLLWSSIKENDPRIKKHIDKIITALPNKPDDQQRELLKILLTMDLSDDEGVLFNICSRLWEKTEKNPSIRFTAMKMMVKIAKKHPDLVREIQLFTEQKYLASLSVAAKKSLLRILKEIGAR